MAGEKIHNYISSYGVRVKTGRRSRLQPLASYTCIKLKISASKLNFGQAKMYL